MNDRNAGTRAPGALARIALALALAAPVAAPAALFEDSDARRAILDLRARVDALQKDVNARLDELTRRVDELGGRNEAGARGRFELQNQIDTLRQEIARLRGQLEVATNELAQTQLRQREFAAEIDNRLKQFEPVAVTIDGKQYNVDQNERRAYDNALALFRAGDFRGAIGALQQFQATYPQSPYAPSVAYWIGSSQYALRDYKGAIATMNSLIERYPDSPRVADALLVVGNAQIETGDRRGARQTFENLTQKFQDTPAAQSARERLASLPKS